MQTLQLCQFEFEFLPLKCIKIILTFDFLVRYLSFVGKCQWSIFTCYGNTQSITYSLIAPYLTKVAFYFNGKNHFNYKKYIDNLLQTWKIFHQKHKWSILKSEYLFILMILWYQDRLLWPKNNFKIWRVIHHPGVQTMTRIPWFLHIFPPETEYRKWHRICANLSF